MQVVKMISDESGDKYEKVIWHYVFYTGGSNSCLCDGQVFGFGEGAAEYEVKEVSNDNRNAITCQDCLNLIREFKKIKI